MYRSFPKLSVESRSLKSLLKGQISCHCVLVIKKISDMNRIALSLFAASFNHIHILHCIFFISFLGQSSMQAELNPIFMADLL